ncbi:hypothetical protein M378DRAFT_193764 [Amanita muscaria Koide BX008]|uniref:Uncharacterized protein n=1 Tax=Amanita muscaria (strain Koide BX008) TaxID=946122 RepID=A0A0C2WTU9_AMAMK|nr:hypothetical protein M378DRAFT_193764 [Amanita muscaria Koide BX008]
MSAANFTETQTITGTLTSLPPAYTQTAHSPSANGYSNAFDDFFGVPITTESRHDRRASAESLPPYPLAESLPTYSRWNNEEPATLAMYLFKFGFLLPLFWMLGVIILLSPLSAPDSTDLSSGWLGEKSDEERQFVVSEMRRVEVKWAKRCLWALSTLVILGVAVGLAIWAVLKSRL